MQVHEEGEPRNFANKDQTVVAIALSPQSNLQGRYFFEILLTGKRLHWSKWTPVNMTTGVIERYHTFIAQDFLNELIFGDQNNQLINPGYCIF